MLFRSDTERERERDTEIDQCSLCVCDYLCGAENVFFLSVKFNDSQEKPNLKLFITAFTQTLTSITWGCICMCVVYVCVWLCVCGCV